jgi:transposase/transcriptional regulator with XRE-family HTH domain
MAIPAAPPRLGALLRRLRKEAGLTQARLAEQAHISQRGLQDLERGVHRAPHRGTLDLLATALGLSGQERAAFLDSAQARPLPLPAPLSPQAPAVPEALAPLVGREGELALVNRFLTGEGASDAAARVLLLAGEPGIGKTRLLQAAAQLAVPRGWCVLFGGCQRRGGEDPYAPLPAALAHHIGLQPPERRGSALEGCAWLVRLLPELAGVLEPLPAVTLAPEQERRLIHAAVARFLANVAGPSGTLLILDDLQWAGPDALDLINTLARTSAAARIVGAYRDTEVQPADPLSLLLADLAQARLLGRRQLGPLAPADAAALLEDLLVDTPGGGGSVDEVLRRAGGTPFFLVSYAQAVQQGSLEEVPWDLAAGVRQRVALLPESARLVLGAAAAVGRRASRELLAAVVEQPEETVVAGLEAACGARLLLEEGDDAYVFAHDLIRDVLEADLGAARRAMLHLRVAEALEAGQREAAPELLAFHYGRGGAWDKAVRYLELAGDHAAAQCANRVAEAHYREALGRRRRVEDVARLREKLGMLLYRIGKYDAALALLEAAAATYRASDDWVGLVRVTAGIGWAYCWRGTSEEGIAPLSALLQRLERQDAPPPLGALYGALGMALYITGQYDEALAACGRAIDLVPVAGDERSGILAEWLRVNLLILLGRLGEALQAGQEALPRTELLGDWLCLTQAHRYLAEIHILYGALETGQEHVARALASATALGGTAQLSLALSYQAWIALLRGEWHAARAALEQALALSGQIEGWQTAPYAQLFLARLSLAEGDWAAAATAGGEATTLARGTGDLQGLRWASGVLAELEILEGRPEAARARLVPLLDRPGLREYDVTMLLPVLGWAQLELGQPDLAAASVEQALARARPQQMRLVLVEALRVRALSALHRERWDEAAGSLEEGMALVRAMPYPYAEARLLHLDGLLRVQRGEPGAARERLEAARAIFARLGARMDLERVEQALGALSQNQGPGRFETAVTDAHWAQVQVLLPPSARTGRRRTDDRRTLEAILYQQRTSCAWAALPAAFGDEATAHRRLRQWQTAGLWERIAAIAGTTPAALAEPASARRRDA